MSGVEAVRDAVPRRAVAGGNGTELGALFASWRAEIGVGTALAGLIAIGGVLAPHFLTFGNFASLLTQTAIPAMVAVGMTLVMIAGEIDLSVGATVGLAGTVFAWLVVSHGLPLLLAGVIVLLGAALIGSAIGTLRVVWDIPSFIITIGLLSTLRGCAFLLSQGVSIGPLPDVMGVLWYGSLAGLPVPVALMVATIALGWLALSQTRFGRHVYALGGDAETAARYGVPVARLRIAVFVLVQLLAAFGGIMLVARLNAGNATLGEQLELDVIAAVIVGGTSLAGGSGRIVGTVIGVLFVAVLRNEMVLVGVYPIGFMIAQGLVIVLAVWWSRLRNRGPRDGRRR